jgi:hypothetical protein
MEAPPLDIEQDFLVKESRTINTMAGVALLAVFLVSLSFGDYGWYSYLFLFPFSLYLAQ